MLAGDIIRDPRAAALLKATGMGIKTYGLVELGNDKMYPKEFFNAENWKGFLIEIFADFSREIYDWLPDQFNPWLDLNYNGTHTFYDPLILDLDGNGISTAAIDNKYFDKNTFFDFDGDGIAHATGWTTTDGITYQMGDVDFNFSHVFSQQKESLDTKDVKHLLNLAGRGKVRSLQEAKNTGNQLY